jgi:phosphoribosyl 1,2-cyclic phosphodiesterase
VGCALSAVGQCAADLAGIFITHEHTDHIGALDQLCKHEGVPVHASCGTADALLHHDFVRGNLVRHHVIYTETVGALTVTAFPLPHDSACHVGYIVRDSEGDALLIATDMGHICEDLLTALPGCRGALIEANHDIALLRCGPYPAYLKSRILSPVGHLSNEDCARVAAHARDCGVRHIALGHLSEENNTPKLARDTVSAALIGSDVSLTVCDRCAPTRIM